MKNKYITYGKSWIKRIKYLWKIKSLNLKRLEVSTIDYEKRVGCCLGCSDILANDCSICKCNIYDKCRYITEECARPTTKKKWK